MHHVHLRARMIVKTKRIQPIGDRVIGLVDQVVRAPQRGPSRRAMGSIPKLTLGLGVAGRQHCIEDRPFAITGCELLGQVSRGIEVDVHALVDVLVASGEREDQRLVTIVLVAGGELSELEKLLSRVLPLIRRDRPCAKPVR